MIGLSRLKKWLGLTRVDLSDTLYDAHSLVNEVASTVRFDYKTHSEVKEIGKSWVEIFPRVQSIECSLTDEDCTVLNIQLGKNAEIPKHHHKYSDSDVFVVSGKIQDLVSGKVYKQGSVMPIPRSKDHHIKALEDSTITVVYRPPF